MPEFDSQIFDGLKAGLAKTQKQLPTIVGKEAVAFTKQNFDLQGYRGDNLQPWAKHQNKADKGLILVKRGFLKNAVMVLGKTNETVTFGVDGKLIPYAQIHNEGGIITIPITAKLRKWAWAMYYKESGPNPKGGNKGTGPRPVANNDMAGMYKAIALTKKEKLTVKIPKRQFMPIGNEHSQMMDAYLVNIISKQLQLNMENIV